MLPSPRMRYPPGRGKRCFHPQEGFLALREFVETDNNCSICEDVSLILFSMLQVIFFLINLERLEENNTFAALSRKPL